MKRLVLLFVLVATPAVAQQDIVAKYRGLYPTPMTAEQKVALLRGVATEVHGGLLVKPDGNNCLGYACDIVCFSPTALFDVLQAEGEAAIPAWNATTNPRGYACELVTTVPAPTPTPVSPPSVDLTAVLAQLDRLAKALDRFEQDDRTDQQQLIAKLDDLAAKIDEPGWVKKALSNPYVQMALTAVGTYYTTKAALK